MLDCLDSEYSTRMPSAEPSHTCWLSAHGVANRLNAASEAGSLDAAAGLEVVLRAERQSISA